MASTALKQGPTEAPALPKHYRSWLDQSRFLRTIEYYYPFSFAGSLLAASVVLLLGYAYAGNNIYALALSALGFGALSVLLFFGRLQAYRLGDPDIVWRAHSALVSRHTDGGFEIGTGEYGIFYFFRLHFRIHGILLAGRKAPMYVSAEASATRAGNIFLPFYAPVSGLLDLRGRLMVRDVFGLTRTRVAPVQSRQFLVSPPSFPLKQKIIFKNSASLESTRRMLNAEEEKYYMREYIPGDRLKDINWKASFRLDELITKIAPKSPEESRLLHVELRHFTSESRDCAESILHLNYVKSWLLSFLWEIYREHPEYRFEVFTADEIFLLESEADIQAFSQRLASISYVQARSFDHPLSPSQEKFIFTTMYDRGLAYSLASEGRVVCHVFRTKRGRGRNARPIRLLPLEQGELPLPGPWIFRKCSAKRAKAAPLTGQLVEEPLLVHLF